jgi:hypothetical protein
VNDTELLDRVVEIFGRTEFRGFDGLTAQSAEVAI